MIGQKQPTPRKCRRHNQMACSGVASFKQRGTVQIIVREGCTQGRRKIDNWGGGGAHIHIFLFTDHVKTIDFKILISISKEINWA